MARPKKGESEQAPAAGVRDPDNKQPGPESHTDNAAGDELDQEAAAGLAQIAREGEAEQQSERAAELDRTTAKDYPYDRQLADALEIINRGLFVVAAGRGGRHWMLSDQEAAELSKAEAQCIEKYVGSVHLGPAVSLVFCTAGIVGPRLAETGRLKAEAQRQADKAAESAQQQQEGGAHGTD